MFTEQQFEAFEYMYQQFCNSYLSELRNVNTIPFYEFYNWVQTQKNLKQKNAS